MAPGREGAAGPAPPPTVMSVSRDASKLVLARSLDAINMAAGMLGVEEMTADQIADTVTERFGLPVSRDTVAATLENADEFVQRVRRGGTTLYRFISPPGEAGSGRSRSKSASNKKSAAKKKSAKKKSAKKE